MSADIRSTYRTCWTGGHLQSPSLIRSRLGAPETAFLTSSQVMPVLLVQKLTLRTTDLYVDYSSVFFLLKNK